MVEKAEKPEGASDWVVLGTARDVPGGVRNHILSVLNKHESLVVEEYTTDVKDDDPVHVRVYAETPEMERDALTMLQAVPSA